MKKMKLSLRNKIGVHRWLSRYSIDKIRTCPFPHKRGHTICVSWFPKTRSTICSYNPDKFCPCYLYSIKYVTKVARKMIK